MQGTLGFYFKVDDDLYGGQRKDDDHRAQEFLRDVEEGLRPRRLGAAYLWSHSP